MVYGGRMKLNKVDLNLLKIFVTVYQERSLRKASEKLFVTTPAVSQSIKKLKESLGEELFVLSNKQFLPTPYSDSLYQKVFPLLEGLAMAIEEGKQFDPCQINEEFHVECNPHVLPWLTPELYLLLSQQSPGSTLVTHTISKHSIERLQQGLVDVVVHFEVENLPSDIIAVPIATLTFVLAVRKNHPYKGTNANIDELLEYPFAHVDMAYLDPNKHSRLEEEVTKLGKSMAISLRTTSLSGLIETIKQTDIIAPCMQPVVERYKNDIRAVFVDDLEQPALVEVYAFLNKKNQHAAKFIWLLDLIDTVMANSKAAIKDAAT